MEAPPLLISFPRTDSSISLIGEELGFSQEEMAMARDLFMRDLPPLVKTSCLPYLLGVSPKLIGAMEVHPERYYRAFSIPKTKGGKREIQAPRQFLKIIQKWIYRHILLSKDLPPHVTGFAQGRSIFSHANNHIQGKNLMVVDIEDFFPSITVDAVHELFQQFGYPAPVALQLARLCTLNGRLPQGAPTSPSIANHVFLLVDQELFRLADTWGCRYSRYADDLAFSGERLFKEEDIHSIETILVGSSFKLNQAKSRRVGAGSRQILTGLVVNTKAQPPRTSRRVWRATFDRASKHPGEFADKVDRLSGVAAFVNQYDPQLANKYAAVIQKVRQVI